MTFLTRTPIGRARVGGMGEQQRPGTATLTLELDLGADPIGGWLTGEASGARPFSSWIDLMAALESARAAALQALGSTPAPHNATFPSPTPRTPKEPS
jgi:hypothetical protein